MSSFVLHHLNHRRLRAVFSGCAASWLGTAAVIAADPPRIEVRSPGGDVSIGFWLERDGGVDQVPRWSVGFRGKPVILASRLGVELEERSALGGPCAIESVSTSSRREEYDVFPGKRSRVTDHYTEAVVSLRERAAPRRAWEVVLRAHDDGAALRYRFPAQEGWSRLAIASERTEFAVPPDTIAHVLPRAGFATSYEGFYETKRVPELPEAGLIALPVLLECPGSVWAAITEANLTDYAGMYLSRSGGRLGVLTSRLSPLPGGGGLAVKAPLPHVSPWRVVLLGDDVGRLIESDLIFNLNEPCAIRDTSWIHPGKTMFPWWNGYYLENVPFQPGLNTPTMKHYIDFCAESGIPYHSLDGLAKIAWYGGPTYPYEGADITKAIGGLDLPDVIDYARKKNVKLRLWVHWEGVRAQMDQAFPLYASWGIEGVMLDFMDRDDQEMVQFLAEVLRRAAENHLTVTLHGASKPTGLERTYPNLLTSEGVLNLEYDKWDKVGCPPEHQVTVPFTRMLAGPLDFHQGSFRCVDVESFAPRNWAPVVMGTPSRTLASYVVYLNHLPMVADYPSAYRGHPGFPVLARIPTYWDDTRALAGKVGEYVVIARRQGNVWYVGAMNGRARRSLDVPLGFLRPGRFRAETFADSPTETTRRLVTGESELDASGVLGVLGVLKIAMEPSGGHLTVLTPVQDGVRRPEK